MARQVPKWAQELVIRVALDELRERLPDVTWSRRKGTTSSGYTLYSTGECPDRRIVLRAGKERRDQKLVLLHELAHWLIPEGQHHSPTYWDKCWDLYYRYGVPIRYALTRERNYRKGAVVAYKRRKEHKP
ncbi:hypothetical protein LCGC14_2662390 [marine sediment metagenome]|uniref:SprT-like domain-containing protein n=1 Tax=marine sediment metagenome TaxID=412755 RepID=A0A0F9ADY0_9ZZZZ